MFFNINLIIAEIKSGLQRRISGTFESERWRLITYLSTYMWQAVCNKFHHQSRNCDNVIFFSPVDSVAVIMTHMLMAPFLKTVTANKVCGY